MDEDLARSLTRITAILELAFREQIESARARVLADDVTNALLSTTAEQWVPAGRLIDKSMAATNESKRTVQRRIASLLGQGLLEQAGTGRSTKYRSTGII